MEARYLRMTPQKASLCHSLGLEPGAGVGEEWGGILIIHPGHCLKSWMLGTGIG